VKLFRINFDVKLFLKELFPVFDSLRREQTESSIRLKFSVPKNPESVLVSSDPSRLRQVFTNLISNAFKFTHRGYVEYGFEINKNRSIRFFVKDTGLGISKEYQEEIFKRFVQEPRPLTAKKEGTGLGLSITQSLISMLEGEIWVESELGKGSIFYFEFQDIMIGGDPDTSEDYSWENKEILVIEDEISDYVSLEDILKGRVKVHYVDSPESALEFCSVNEQIDVCLYHWRPGQSLDFIHDIQKMKKDHPVIACLDRGVKGNHKDIIKKHFSDNIIKPYGEQNVLRTLDKFLR
jgi:CheY-like chemotaxis protein